ncbi:MAG: caspase family protein [Myxococcales bacterium]|nr:caspase family protein [Myxococcales bacterium]
MGRRIALLVGISEYGPGFNPLPSSERDIKALGAVLRSPERGQFEVFELTNPDPQRLREAIEDVLVSAGRNDMVLLYYSGHAVKDARGRLFLASPQTRKTGDGELQQSTAVPSEFVHDCMDRSRCRHQVVILDCCFSGAFAEGLSAKDDRTVDVKRHFGGEGRAVLTSSTSMQYSFEREGSALSVYTRFLVEGIRSGAADLDSDGWISTDELHEYARRRIAETCPSMRPRIFPVREGYKMHVSRAPVLDPTLRYRREVEKASKGGEISEIGRQILRAVQQELQLNNRDARLIEDQVLAPIRDLNRRIELFQQQVRKLRRAGQLQDPRSLEELDRYRAVVLRLDNSHVEAIMATVLSGAAKNDKWTLAASTTTAPAGDPEIEHWRGRDIARRWLVPALALPAVLLLVYAVVKMSSVAEEGEPTGTQVANSSSSTPSAPSVAAGMSVSALPAISSTRVDKDVPRVERTGGMSPRWRYGEWVLRVSADRDIDEARRNADYIERNSSFATRILRVIDPNRSSRYLYYVLLGGFSDRDAAQRDRNDAKLILREGAMVVHMSTYCLSPQHSDRGFDYCD